MTDEYERYLKDLVALAASSPSHVEGAVRQAFAMGQDAMRGEASNLAVSFHCALGRGECDAGERAAGAIRAARIGGVMG